MRWSAKIPSNEIWISDGAMNPPNTKIALLPRVNGKPVDIERLTDEEARNLYMAALHFAKSLDQTHGAATLMHEFQGT